ncbi:hypothetical protein N658DRAFT_501445 [Parathielavia hyrcaniae]|uniref:Uncharacterized protein n=1 Tax=Parathielavia hyrcaniae TaxID=113614 RepID=A0AAN6PRC8_9PEZI|nr:hypothetical protein N658DRAFT_501445 [Parathielavia hyrcaniae]
MATPSELLSPLTNPSTATREAITAAVEGFTTQIQSVVASGESVGGYTQRAFFDLFEAAGRTPFDQQDALVEFSIQLQKTTATDAEGKPLICEHGHTEVWKDLPYFDLEARETINFDPDIPDMNEDERAVVENQAAFMARLSASPSPAFDLSLFGLWMLRSAFEEHKSAPSEIPPAEISRTAARIAAFWIRFKGEEYRKQSSRGVTLPDNLGVSWGKYKERGWRGFNEDRWQVWKDGLRAAHEKFPSDEVIKAALEAM